MQSLPCLLPLHLQKQPPKPSSPDVYIQEQPAFTAFVSQFGGFAMDDWTISSKAKELTQVGQPVGVGAGVCCLMKAEQAVGVIWPLCLQHARRCLDKGRSGLCGIVCEGYLGSSRICKLSL